MVYPFSVVCKSVLFWAMFLSRGVVGVIHVILFSNLIISVWITLSFSTLVMFRCCGHDPSYFGFQLDNISLDHSILFHFGNV